LGVQALAAVCITFWGFFSTFLLLWFVNKVTPLRMSVEDEILGADYAEHNISSRYALPQAKNVDTLRDEKSENNSRGFRLHQQQSEDGKKMAGIYKTYELTTDDRSKAMTHENSAFQHDENA
jgi:hypothetical protein